jgi:hypothetical protein
MVLIRAKHQSCKGGEVLSAHHHPPPGISHGWDCVTGAAAAASYAYIYIYIYMRAMYERKIYFKGMRMDELRYVQIQT